MDKHSPTPWRVEKSPNNSNFWVVRCDTGVSLATAWHEADAKFIVEAVNAIDETLNIRRALLGWTLERDRIRDIMRGLVAILETVTLEDHEIELLDEAREAIGEAQP